MFFSTPDGESFFYNLLRLVGISPGIPVGANSTLYIYGIIPIAAAIVCVKKVLRYWQGYGLRFKCYNVFLRALPIIIIVPLFLVSTNMIMSPSGIDRIYYAVISQRNGLQATTFSSTSNFLEYEFSGDTWKFTYNFTLENHGNETLEFNIVLTPKGHGGFPEALIRDENGEAKTFTLLPTQRMHVMGESIDYRQTADSSGSGRGTFSIILINDHEQFSPKQIVRR